MSDNNRRRNDDLTREERERLEREGTSTRAGADETLEVVEEDIQVGKRQVEGGGVRASTHVTETPVEKEVQLHEEHVEVERRPVDRPADADAFREQPIEATEYSEEAVVSKQARVIEEVVLNKDVRDRTETVRDTVRRTDVEVEDLGGRERTSGTSYETGTTAGSSYDTGITGSGVSDSYGTGGSTGNYGAYETYETDFRTHYDTNYMDTGYSYDQFTPAYRYGHALASYEGYSDSDWSDIENEARSDWESKNPGTWDEFRHAVHEGWDRVRNR